MSLKVTTKSLCLSVMDVEALVFLGKTLYSQSASLHPGVQMGTSKCARGNPAMDWHPFQGGVAALLAVSC